MTTTTLRPFEPTDLEATVSMQCRAVDLLGRSHYSDEETALLIAASREPDYAEALFGNDLWLAVDRDGAIVGSAGWGAVVDASGSAPPRGRVRKVFVEPALAGQGLGRVLVEAAQARAVAAGCRGFVVRANLNAVAFYQRLGYRVTRAGSLTVGGRSLPMTMMEKPVESCV